MARNTIPHPELDAPGFETTRERDRRAYREALRDAGVRPAWGSMNRADRQTVKPRRKWIAALLRLLPWG